MKCRKSNIPENSLVNSLQPFDYRDSFEYEFETEREITPDDIQTGFWTHKPAWIEFLFKLRNLLVKPFGIHTGEVEDTRKMKECIRSGSSYRFVSIEAKSPFETVLSLDDKHLRAYLAVHIEEMGANRRKVRAITVVRFKYWLGKTYFAIISPFHTIIVKSSLKQTIEELRKTQQK